MLRVLAAGWLAALLTTTLGFLAVVAGQGVRQVLGRARRHGRTAALRSRAQPAQPPRTPAEQRTAA